MLPSPDQPRSASPSIPVAGRGTPVALDFQATTPCDPVVIKTMEPWWSQHWGNPSSRQHQLGLMAAAAVSDARERLARCLEVLPSGQLLQLAIRSGTREEFQELAQTQRLIHHRPDQDSTTLAASLQSLAKGARLVIVGFHTGSPFTVQASQMVANEWEILGSRNVTKQELAEVVALVDAGRIRPIVTGVYPLAEAEAVHRRLQDQEIIGRVVLQP